MRFKYNDGGRSKYFKAKNVGDCVVRAIAIATEKDYMDVYNDINELAKKERIGKKKKDISSARNGVYKETYEKYLRSMGWKWKACMSIGTGCQVHLNDDELPEGRIICRLSKHLTAVIDGELNDVYDCSREGTRCVYGYWYKEE